MTRVRWTTDAADDLARIVERIREDNPEAGGALLKPFIRVGLVAQPSQPRAAWPRREHARACLRSLALHRSVRGYREPTPGAGAPHTPCLERLALKFPPAILHRKPLERHRRSNQWNTSPMR